MGISTTIDIGICNGSMIGLEESEPTSYNGIEIFGLLMRESICHRKNETTKSAKSAKESSKNIMIFGNQLGATNPVLLVCKQFPTMSLDADTHSVLDASKN